MKAIDGSWALLYRPKHATILHYWRFSYSPTRRQAREQGARFRAQGFQTGSIYPSGIVIYREVAPTKVPSTTR